MNRSYFDPELVYVISCSGTQIENTVIKFTIMLINTVSMVFCFVGLILNVLIMKTCGSMSRLTHHYQIFLFVAIGNFVHILSLLVFLWILTIEIMQLRVAIKLAKTLSLFIMVVSFTHYWGGNCTTYGALVATIHQVVVVKYPLKNIVHNSLYPVYIALFIFDGAIIFPSIFMFVINLCDPHSNIFVNPRPGRFALTYMIISDGFLKPAVPWIVILPMMMILYRLLKEFGHRGRSRSLQNAFIHIILRLNLVYFLVTVQKILNGLFLWYGFVYFSRIWLVLTLVILYTFDAVVSSLYFIIYYTYDKQFRRSFRQTRKMWLLRKSLIEKKKYSVTASQEMNSN